MFRSFIDSFLFPTTCHVCGRKLVDSEKYICLHCLPELPHTGFVPAGDNPVMQHYALEPAVSSATSLFVYHSGVRKLVHDAKYHNNTDLAHHLGTLMAYEYAGTDFFRDVDFLVPVPLHWLRKFFRGYNQSRIISDGIAAITGLPVDDTHLVRTRNNRSQTALSHDERQRHKEGLFALRHPEEWHGRHIMLVDDVYTTGATIDACISAIKAAGQDIHITIYTLAYAGLTPL